MTADELPSWLNDCEAVGPRIRRRGDRPGLAGTSSPSATALRSSTTTARCGTERPVYAQLLFALDRAAELGHPTSLEELHAGGMAALMKLLALTHAGVTTDEFDAACRSWLASARHPRFGRPYPATVYQPMLELLGMLRPPRLLLLDLLRRRHGLHADMGERCLACLRTG